MKQLNYKQFKEELLRIKRIDMIKNKDQKAEMDFLKSLTETFVAAGNLNLSEAARLEVSLILRGIGVPRLRNYYKVRNTVPIKNIFEINKAKTPEFPLTIFSTIAYGTDGEAKDFLNCFKGDAFLPNIWLEANSSKINTTEM